MSSEDGAGSYHQQTQTPGSQTCSSQTLSNCVNGPSSSGTGGGRKRSSNSSQNHYQQHHHSQQQPSHYKENTIESNNKGSTSGAGLYMDRNDPQMGHGTNYNSNASPSRYYNSDAYLLGGRITAVAQEK